MAATGAVLFRAGGGSLTVSLDSGDELMQWLDATSPPVIATALLRLVALAACGYLIVALTVAVLAGLAPHRRLGLLLGQLAPAAIRRAVIYGARSGLATTVALGSLGSLGSLTASPAGATPTTFPTLTPDADPPPHVVTMSKLTPGVPAHPGRPADAASSPATADPHPSGASSADDTVRSAGTSGSSDDSTTEVSSAGSSEAPPSTATMIHLGPAADPPSGPSIPTTPTSPPGTTTPTTRPPGPASTAPRPTSPPTSTSTSAGASTSVPSPHQPEPLSPPATTEPSRADDEWVVGPGDSFWSIAEEALRDARAGTQPADAEISRYWKALIAANRTRLTAPDNPDLLHVGQALILPPPD